MPAHQHELLYWIYAGGGNTFQTGGGGDTWWFGQNERNYSNFTGSNKPHSILNPYYTVYIFRRTA